MYYISQGAVKFVKAEYKDIGIDTNNSNEIYNNNRTKNDRNNNTKYGCSITVGFLALE